MGRDERLNDRERELWVNNDEGLYRWWRATRLNMRTFLRTHRAELDTAILAARDGVHTRPTVRP